MTNLLTYGMDVKNSGLMSQGWSLDTTSKFSPNEKTANASLTHRNKWFREDYNISNEYRKEGFTMCGRLMHELAGTDKCLPPGIY